MSRIVAGGNEARNCRDGFEFAGTRIEQRIGEMAAARGEEEINNDKALNGGPCL